MAGLLDALFGQRAQVPGSTQPMGLGGLLAPEVALPAAAALLSNQGNSQNFANAFGAMGQGIVKQRELQAQTAQKNKTLDFLRQQAPEYAQAVEAGALQPGDAYKMFLEARKAQKGQGYINAGGGNLFNSETGEWVSAPGGGSEGVAGLQPVWLQDENGNPVIGQATKDGRVIRSEMPQGLTPVGPYQKAFDTGRGGAAGKAQGEASFDLPRVEQNAAQTLGVLERMKTHPGRAGSTGFVEGMLPSRTSDQVDFQSLVDQTQGQSFLQAFQMLKGGGQITEIEGQKATDAISRLRNQRLSDADYVRAITDLEDVIKAGLTRARQQAGQGGGGAVDYKTKYGLD